MTNARKELERDNAALAAAESDGTRHFRTWRCRKYTVVVGRNVAVREEVDEAYCEQSSIEVIRRTSGGRTVLIGPGTLQYAIALPYRMDSELVAIDSSKKFCNRLLITGLAGALKTPVKLGEDCSGDLTFDRKKVGGLAIRRGRNAMLLHGTLLMHADIEAISRALRHPQREPAYRAGRSHLEFLSNLGEIDDAELTASIVAQLARFPPD